MNLAELKRDYTEGKIDRSDFRRQVDEEALKLREVQKMIAGSVIRQIEIGGEDIIAHMTSDLAMYWEPEDMGSAPNIAFIHGDYEPEESELLFALAEGKTAILDIGANVGWYSLHFAKSASMAGGRVYSIEPVPWTFEKLQRNIQLNGLSNVIRPYKIGLGDKPGNTTFFVPTTSGPSAASIVDLHPDEQSTQVTCAVERVDDFLAREAIEAIQMVKCDVEGAELLVLHGASRLLEVDRPVFFFELLRKWAKQFDYHPNAVIELLAKNGYKCWAVGKGIIQEVEGIDDDTLETNFLFLTDEHQRELDVVKRMSRR